MQDYVGRLTRQVNAIPVRYSDNILVNAILTPRLEQAAQAGIRVKADIQVPEQLGIRDEDLVVYLTNLLANAMEAASAAKDTGSAFLSLRMEVKGGRLLVSCENSYSAPLLQLENGRLASTKSQPGHGYGLSIMRRVAERYDSVLLVDHSDGVFRVQTSLNQRREGAKR